MNQLQQPVVLWNTNMTDKQAILDKVVRHLASMSERSYEEDKCKYRTVEGNKCAVGCLFDGYDPVLERDPILAHLIADGYVPTAPWRTMNLLTDLQICHDDPFSWGLDALSDYGWEILDKIADKHGLTMPDLEVQEV